MADLTETIKDLLYDNWTLTGNNKKEKITFRRGEPYNLMTRFQANKITIEIGKFTNIVTKRTLATDIENELIPINLWMMVKPSTEAEMDALYDDRDTIVKHIRSIIKTNQRSVTDVRLAYRNTERHLDDLGTEPPVLRTRIEISCKSTSR